MYKIATWNVNSINVRLAHLLDWLAKNKPDVLAIQETKSPDDKFPVEAIESLGFEVQYSGQKTYNGVAIISRLKSKDSCTDVPELDDPQRRILAVTIGDIRVINLYIPNGQSLASEKFEYKMDWLDKVQSYIKAQLKKYPKLVVLGDFNIAPDDRDVHDPAAWLGKVHVSPQERECFQDFIRMGLVDCFRIFEQGEGHFSWWDYRMAAFRRKMGLRIDHILASEALATACQRCFIDIEPRKLERPSDHTVVCAEFNES